MKEIHFIIRVTESPCAVLEFDSLAELMDNYKDGDIVAKKIPVVLVPEAN